MEQISHRSVTIQFQNSSRSVLLHFWNISKATFPFFCSRTVSELFCYCSRTKMGLAKSLICSRRALDAGSITVHGEKILEIMIGIVLEQFRKIENSSRTLEHDFAGEEIQ